MTLILDGTYGLSDVGAQAAQIAALENPPVEN
jgi:hypothetical protein